MDYERIKSDLMDRTEGLHSDEWMDSDKIRLIALIFKDLIDNPLSAYATFRFWGEDDNGDNRVTDDLLRIADGMGF